MSLREPKKSEDGRALWRSSLIVTAWTRCGPHIGLFDSSAIIPDFRTGFLRGRSPPSCSADCPANLTFFQDESSMARSIAARSYQEAAEVCLHAYVRALRDFKIEESRLSARMFRGVRPPGRNCPRCRLESLSMMRIDSKSAIPAVSSRRLGNSLDRYRALRSFVSLQLCASRARRFLALEWKSERRRHSSLSRHGMARHSRRIRTILDNC